jgi:SpoIVB peptidase S55
MRGECSARSIAAHFISPVAAFLSLSLSGWLILLALPPLVGGAVMPCRFLLALPLVLAVSVGQLVAGAKPDSFWRVEDVRCGMKGQGRTVMKGTRVETFQAEILGVLQNTSPGRDLILARLSGLDLEKTGVIAGMSGSPVYIEGKLLGAVAFAWPYGKEPIAGITPFAQMDGFVQAFERRDLTSRSTPRRVGLSTPFKVDGKEFDTVTISQDFDSPAPTAADGMWMVPLRSPMAATGFTSHSLKLLEQRTKSWGLVPVTGGSATARIADEAKNVELEPGGPLAVSLIQGDFDLSGIGTVTHIEGERVYGWGHPFMSLGGCDFPLKTGYIHTVFPRQTVSFKMGSPLKTVGVINADVSTCIAGWIGRKPEMLPVRMTVALNKEHARIFNVEIARQRSLLPTLVYTALTNSVDMEGELPEEMTARFRARIELEEGAPIVIDDTFSGFAGGRAPQALYSQVASVVSLLTFNPLKELRIRRIECETQIEPGRQSADIETAELGSDVYRPGDTIKATVQVRPHKGAIQRIAVSLKLPVDLPEGNYSATLCDEVTATRMTLRGNPVLANPTTASQILEGLALQSDARRTNLVLRISTGAHGVATGGKALPHLPGSMVQILSNARRSGAQTMSGALAARQPTEWVIQGGETVRFTVSKTPRLTRPEE